MHNLSVENDLLLLFFARRSDAGLNIAAMSDKRLLTVLHIPREWLAIGSEDFLEDLCDMYEVEGGAGDCGEDHDMPYNDPDGTITAAIRQSGHTLH